MKNIRKLINNVGVSDLGGFRAVKLAWQIVFFSSQ